MPRKYQEKYYDLPEAELQDLLVRAQDRDQQAQLQLLEIFQNFLTKYVTLLWTGKCSFSDYDIRRFVALFVKDGGLRFYLMRNKLDSKGMKLVREIILGVVYMCQRYGTEEDVEQTVRLAFLSCASTYRRRGEIPFSGYLYSYYFYVLKKMVDTFLIDQLGRKTFPLLIEADENSDADDDRPQGFAGPSVPSVEELLIADEIDEYWVAATSYPPFDILTPAERQLLKWRYVDGERASAIAVRITEHQNVLRERYKVIREKLHAAIAADLAEMT